MVTFSQSKTHSRKKKHCLSSILRLGIPLVVIIGRKASDPDNPQFELHFMYDEKECDLTLNDLTAEIAKYSMDKLRE